MNPDYFVYILANASRMLYVGVTNNLKRRVYEHRNQVIPGYTSRYRINRLIWFEETPNVRAAITREKQIKGWIRAKKVVLIEAQNPAWNDLAAGWYDEAITTEAN
jgi:putative endonuclease